MHILTEEDILNDIGFNTTNGSFIFLTEGIGSFVSKIFRKASNMIHQMFEAVRQIIMKSINFFRRKKMKTYSFTSVYQLLLSISVKISLVIQSLLDNVKDDNVDSTINTLKSTIAGVIVGNGYVRLQGKLFDRKLEVTSGQISNTVDLLSRSSKSINRYHTQLVNKANKMNFDSKEELTKYTSTLSKLSGLVSLYMNTASKVSTHIIKSAEPV